MDFRRLIGRVRPPRQATESVEASPDAPAEVEPNVPLLTRSPLFDESWYSQQVGKPMDRRAAIEHYLATPRPERASPSPLFERNFFRENHGQTPHDRDEFLVYHRKRRFKFATSPLFDPVEYRRRVPEARKHRYGPLGHYLEIGADAGIRANDWLAAPDGTARQSLLGWIGERSDEWEQRQAHKTGSIIGGRRQKLIDTFLAERDAPPTSGPVVDIIVDPGSDFAFTGASCTTVQDQTYQAWHLWILDDGTIPALADSLAATLASDSYDVIDVVGRDFVEGVAAALTEGAGAFVAFLTAGDTWETTRLAHLVGEAERTGADVLHDVMHRIRKDGQSRWVVGSISVPLGETVDRARLMLRTAAVRAAGGVRVNLREAWDLDLVGRIAGTPAELPVIGVHRDTALAAEARYRPPRTRQAKDPRRFDSWTGAALNELLIDWEQLATLPREPGLVSVIIPTYTDWAMTSKAVESVVTAAADSEIPVECLVYDNGSGRAASVILDSLPLRYPGVRVIHSARNHGFALGNNLAVAEARGEMVVFLNNDTEVDPGWLEPLVAALHDDQILGAQSLLVFPTGTIQSAGVAFPATCGSPHAFLANFPIEDATGIEDLNFHALTGAALAVRYDDIVALRGFDPIFQNGMEDVDLCLRLGELRAGRFTVLPQSRVIHHESRSPGRFDSQAQNRELYLDRWAGRAPRDDHELWSSRGFTVVDHEIVAGARRLRWLAVADPVLVRTDRLSVSESARPLRWAIKNPAPWSDEAERWGDTHFARSLAEALRELGQEVVIDHRPSFERPTGRHDDVSLVLRGLAPYLPSVEHVTIAWVISHPEMLSAREAESYDRVVAASETWAAEASRLWRIPIEPMLQATDPGIFNPDSGTPDSGHPILFVGSSRQQYRPIVREAVENGLALSVYGTQWEEFLPKGYLKGQYLPNAELAHFYRSAGVVLNDHWDDMRTQGFLSNRLFDAVASGARVLTDDIPGVENLFGSSVRVWKSPSDLIAINSERDLDRLFGSDEERRDNAARVARDHSFLARAERLISIAQGARKERGFDR